MGVYHGPDIRPLPIDHQMQPALRGGVAVSLQDMALQVAQHQHVRRHAALSNSGRSEEDPVLLHPDGDVAVVADHVAPRIEETADAADLLPNALVTLQMNTSSYPWIHRLKTAGSPRRKTTAVSLPLTAVHCVPGRDLCQ